MGEMPKNLYHYTLLEEDPGIHPFAARFRSNDAGTG
jgi:hypothetical protein